MASLAAWRSIAQTGREVRRWGWPGASGLGLLIAAAAVALGWLPALRNELATLNSATADAEFTAARLGSKRQTLQNQAPQAHRFRDSFPPAQSRQERLAALWSLAAEHGLDAKRSELRLSPSRELDLLRYSVSMPLAGPYAQVRAFVEDAQRRDPALAVDHLRLRRASAGAALVDADLTWSFYMQPEPSLATQRDAVRRTSR